MLFFFYSVVNGNQAGEQCLATLAIDLLFIRLVLLVSYSRIFHLNNGSRRFVACPRGYDRRVQQQKQDFILDAIHLGSL